MTPSECQNTSQGIKWWRCMCIVHSIYENLTLSPPKSRALLCRTRKLETSHREKGCLAMGAACRMQFTVLANSSRHWHRERMYLSSIMSTLSFQSIWLWGSSVRWLSARGIRRIWFQILGLLLTRCVTLGKSLKLSVPQLPSIVES